MNGTVDVNHGYAMHAERDGLETKIRVRLSKNIMEGNDVVDISDGQRIIGTVNIREGSISFTSRWVEKVEEQDALVDIPVLSAMYKLHSWRFIIKEHST